jgi:hypothetical protein
VRLWLVIIEKPAGRTLNGPRGGSGPPRYRGPCAIPAAPRTTQRIGQRQFSHAPGAPSRGSPRAVSGRSCLSPFSPGSDFRQLGLSELRGSPFRPGRHDLPSLRRQIGKVANLPESMAIYWSSVTVNQQKHSLQNFFKHTGYPGRHLSAADLENAKQNAVHLINAARTSPEALHEEAQRLFMPAAEPEANT